MSGKPSSTSQLGMQSGMLGMLRTTSAAAWSGVDVLAEDVLAEDVLAVDMLAEDVLAEVPALTPTSDGCAVCSLAPLSPACSRNM